MVATQHDWQLVAPWYRWSDDSTAPVRLGRNSRPVIEKYASGSFVNDFLDEPQRSLKYRDEDLVFRVVENGASKYSLSKKTIQRTQLRKVFLPIHSRFYLVVCELHCDAPGFPRVKPDEVHDAGFVVRRRRPLVPETAQAEVHETMTRVARTRAKVSRASSGVRVGPSGNVSVSKKGVVGQIATTARLRRLAKVTAQLELETNALKQLIDNHELGLALEGWKPGEHEGVGAWESVEEEPADLAGESTLPLYALKPDPTDTTHSGSKSTIYYGLLPAGGSDLDEDGAPRFDDRHVYEVRCFVRRTKKVGAKCCPGDIVWSRRSEYFQLASHFDLDGTSNRPTTIQMPDLAALEAQAASMPLGTGAGMRAVTPPDSGLNFSVNPDEPGKPGGPSVGGASICFFALPLITIVAMFLLRLFLPIVVFLFGLWFLLKLKFCILPSVSLDAGLVLAIDAELEIEADLNLSVAADLQFGADILAAIDANFGAEAGGKLVDGFTDGGDIDYNPLGALLHDQATDFSSEVPPELVDDLEPPAHAAPDELKKDRGSITESLEYHEIKELPA